jgi:hypothetical protein
VVLKKLLVQVCISDVIYFKGSVQFRFRFVGIMWFGFWFIVGFTALVKTIA